MSAEPRRIEKPRVKLLLAFVAFVASLSLAASSASSVAEGSGDGQSLGEAPQLTDSELAEELPHVGLDRTEVIDLLSGVFEVQLQSPAGPFDDLAVDHFVSERAAIIEAGNRPGPSGLVVGTEEPPSGNEARLLESTFPLKVNGEVVDLRLENTGDVLTPVNPIAEVRLPEELGDPIELPEIGVDISLVGAPSQLAPSRVENTAIYPNVAPDTDFVAAPTPTGLETMTTLRSGDAPQSHSYLLDLPDGASLREDDGGAVVDLNGQSILRVPAPSALDAEGTSVPVTLTVEDGRRINVSAVPGSDTAYPILIDPIFEAEGQNGSSWAGWSVQSTRPQDMWGVFAGMSPFKMETLVSGNRSYSAGNEVTWRRGVPRYKEEMALGHTPTSYITAMGLQGIIYRSSGGTSSPYVTAGVWDPALSSWAGKSPSQAVWAYPGNGAGLSGTAVNFTTGNDHEAKVAVAGGFTVNESTFLSKERELEVSGVTTELADEDDPVVSKGSASASWANQSGTSSIAATLGDTGLGAKALRFELPGQSPVTLTNSCSGTVSSPCPSEWRPSLGANQYSTTVMPQGWLSIPIIGEDVLGHKSKAGLAEIGIDHTAPSFSNLSGTLTQQATLGTHKLQYGLTFGATDGFEAPAAVQKSFGTSGTGNGQLNNPMGVAVDSSGNVLVVDRNNHRVEKFDQNGTYLGQFGNTGTETQKLFEPRMIAVTSSGRIWVSDTGHQRLVQFSSSGVYLREFKDPTLTTPYGVAAAPGGYLWFTNHSTGEVVKTLEATDGSISIVKKIKGTNNGSGVDTTFSTPAGLAADPQGNVWVADVNHHRLQKVSAAGEIVAQIGSQGSGVAQFNNPYSIAVTGLGHLLVADADNNRIQLLDTQGDMLRTLGGSSSSFSSPKGVAVGPGNTAFITDWGNHRVQKWTNVDLDSQSGIVQSEVLVDGQPRDVFKPSCSGQAVCSIPSRSWTLNAREYTEGAHTVEVAVVDGVGLRSTSASLNIELHPDRNAPQLTLAGTMTEQATLGATRPTYKLKLTASDPEPKEGSLAFDGTFGGVGGPASEGKFETPMDAAVDSSGNVWITDTGNGRLEKFSAQGQFLKQAGSSGTGAGQLRQPGGIAIDPSGNLWVADTQNNRVVEFNSTGGFIAAFGKAVNKTKVDGAASESEQNVCTAVSGNICQAGTAGSTGLQFSGPRGIAVTSGGNVWIADTANNRVVKMSPSGSILNTVSTLNAELGKLKEPNAIAIATDGSLWVIDAGNDRAAQWSSSLSFVRKIGSQGSGFGQFNSPTGIDVDPQGNIWVSDNINHKVQQFSATGQYLMGYGSGNTAGDTIGAWMPWGLAFGSQNYLFVVDYMNRRVQRWAPSALSQSGVVSSTIKVDGKSVDSYNPGCPTENCALSREWTLTSSGVTPGSHLVEATVTDGSGLSTTKSIAISIQEDTTAPQVLNTGPLAEAPEGWVEQKSYSFTASATDTGGYGVKQIRLSIDGKMVSETTSTSCEAGGCAKTKIFNVNAAQYDGGAHEVAVVAEDGAGNWKKQSWTMNVDPSGAVSTAEATDTLEAMEATVPPEEEFEPVASTLEVLEKEIIEAGDNPHFKAEEGQVVSTGVTTDTEIDPVSETITSEGTEGSLELTPDQPVAQAEIVEGSAAVLPSTGVAADTVVRPEYNGLHMFTTVREVAAPVDFGWHVSLNPGQYLVQANSTQIEVRSKTGAVAWLISAESAHDATGKAVETTLSVDGSSDFTLTVNHRLPGVTYPVSAGSSYETGYATVVVTEPSREEEAAEEALDPPSPEESKEIEDEQATASASSGAAHRDPNKIIKRKQAKRMVRVGRPLSSVPAPTASASCGPGSCGEGTPKPVETKGRAHSEWPTDDYWDVEIQDGYFHLHKNYVNFWTEPKCDDDVAWWWHFNLFISNQSTPDHVGPAAAYRGSGNHLTYRCEYTAYVGPLPEEYVLEAGNEMQLWIYPNGFQTTHVGANDLLFTTQHYVW